MDGFRWFYASIAAGVCTIWLGFELDPDHSADPGSGHGFKIAWQIALKVMDRFQWNVRIFAGVMRCISAAYVGMSVCPSVTFVDHVKTNKHIFEIFSPSGSRTILVFLYQRRCRYSDGNPPNGCVKCRWGRPKTRFWTNIWLYWTFVYWCLQTIYRVMLIVVFLGHFRINLHQTGT